MNILVWQPSSAGDVVIASGKGAEGLKMKYPNSHLCWATETKEVICLLTRNPYIDEVKLWFRDPESPKNYKADLRINLHWWGCKLPIQASFLEDLGVLGLVEPKDEVYIGNVEREVADRYLTAIGWDYKKPLVTIMGDMDRPWIVPFNGNGRWKPSECRRLPSLLSSEGYFPLEVSARNDLSYATIAAIIEKSKFFIGAEGSMAHVAAGVGTPTAIIRPVYKPELTMAAFVPSNGKHVVISPKEWCVSCAATVTYERPSYFSVPEGTPDKFPPYVDKVCSQHPSSCLYNISAEEIMDAIKDL